MAKLPSSSPRLRTATLADLDELCRLERECFCPADAFSRPQYRRLLANPRATIRVIRLAGRLAAAYTLLSRSAGAARQAVRRGDPATRVGDSPWRRRGETPISASPCLRVSASGFASGRLYSLAVSREFRGLGLAGRLMADMFRLCRRDGIRRLHLEVRADNAPAIELYKKHRWHIERVVADYYAPGQDGLKMSIAL